MNTRLNASLAALLLASFSGVALAAAPQVHDQHVDPLPAPVFDAKGIARTETVRHQYDSSTEALQVRVDFARDASFPGHSHPGVEIAYVLKGAIEYKMNGQTIRLQAGESLYIPAGTVHSAKNVGAGITSELATYLVEKGKPVVVLK